MLKPEDIEALRKLAADHDRGGFYLKYYDLIKDVDLVAAQHALREAEIATYSGPLGGAIFDASLMARGEARSHPGSGLSEDARRFLQRDRRQDVCGNRTFL